MSILRNSFDNLTEENEELIKKYFTGYDYASSGYTYLANYAWRTGYEIYWEVISGYMFIGAVNPLYDEPHTFFSMPLTADGSYEAAALREAVLEVKGRCEAAGLEFEIGVVPWHMKKFLDEAFPNEISWTCDPGDADYVYLKDKLITLSGRALHKKKNHMNFFKKNYAYKIEKINKNTIDRIMDFVVELRVAKEADGGMIRSLRLEEEAIREYLQLVDCDGDTRPGCRKQTGAGEADGAFEEAENPGGAEAFDEKGTTGSGGFDRANTTGTGESPGNEETSEERCIGCEEIYSVALSIDDKIVGIALGERLSDNTAVEHFEKASDEYRGLYQVLCSEFCKTLPEEIVYVNREEDMGLENLRQAKEALKPDHMEEKLTCRFL